MEKKETVAKINKTKRLVLWEDKQNWNTIRLIKKKKKIQFNNIVDEKVEVTTDNAEIQRVKRNYYKPIKWTAWKKWTNS